MELEDFETVQKMNIATLKLLRHAFTSLLLQNAIDYYTLPVTYP
jgi:hypothetical protein